MILILRICSNFYMWKVMANCRTTKKNHRKSSGRAAVLSFFTTTNLMIAPATHIATMSLRNHALGKKMRSNTANAAEVATALTTIWTTLSKKMQATSER